MRLSKYNTNSKAGEITKISLGSDEWVVFLNNIAGTNPFVVDRDHQLTQEDINWIDSNFCAPMLANTGFINQYGADTRVVSVVLDKKGDDYLRFWLAENGIPNDLNGVLVEIFPGILAEEVLNDFWGWWQNLPTEPQEKGDTLVTKQYHEFGVGHLQAWIKDIIKTKEPKNAWDKYQYNLRPWMYAYEMYLLWMDGDLINNDNGKLTPKNQSG